MQSTIVFLLNIIVSIITAIHEGEEFQLFRLYPTIFKSSFLAAISVNSIVSWRPNRKSTIWHIFLLKFFSRASENSYFPAIAWEMIEIWLRYDANPRLPFWKQRGKSKLEYSEMGVSGDEIVVVSEDEISLMNISMAAHDWREVLSFDLEGTWIERILRERLDSLKDIFTLYDLFKVENLLNIEELLRLINRNKRNREAQNNESMTKLCLSEGQLHDNRDSAPELAPKPLTEIHENPESSNEVALKPDTKTSIITLIKTSIILQNAAFASSLRIWILISKPVNSSILGDL